MRWMCSFDTTAEDVQQFAKFAQIYQLSMASPVKRTAFLNWLLKRIELPANEDCTVELWRRIPHPDTQGLGGPEIDFSFNVTGRLSSVKRNGGQAKNRVRD